MKFTIHQNFKIIVTPNKLNKLVPEIMQLNYIAGDIINEQGTIIKTKLNSDETILSASENADPKYIVLKAIYDGELLPDVEYQIIGSVPVLSKKKNEGSWSYFGAPIIEINDFAELEGDNPIEYPFLTVEE